MTETIYTLYPVFAATRELRDRFADEKDRARAVAEIEGPQTGLELVDGLTLGGYYLFHAIRADLLGRAGHIAQAAAAYDTAIALAGNERERAFLERAREALSRVH